MKTRPYRRPRHGFTLVELLVVITIIIVLAAMSFGAINLVTTKKNNLTTQASITAAEQAFEQFYSEYQRLPSVGAGRDQLELDGQSGSELLEVLLGKENAGNNMQNPRQLAFLNAQISKTKKKGGLVYNSSNRVEGLYDAWGNPLNVRFDDDYDDEIRDPIQQGNIIQRKKVIVWSNGADGKPGGNDDVKSW